MRSFLGLAGDCAVATIEGRGVEEEILELGVPVRVIGDPQLGDRVAKSGRTTGVTWGVVTRVHTITSMRYGDALEKVGGFEIGPDADRPADDGEISMGAARGRCGWQSSAVASPT